MLRRNKNRLIIYFLSIALMLTTIAYAIVQTSLNVTGTAIKAGGSFNVYFTNLSSPQIVGNASTSGVSLQTTSLSFNVVLKEPLDSVTYTFDVTNQGTVNAVLSTVSLFGATVAKTNNVTYSLTYNNGLPLNEGDLLLTGQTKKLKLKISYDDVDYISANDVNLEVGASLIYQQTDSSVPTL